MNVSIPLTHLYWFELPWNYLKGKNKKEKKKYTSILLKQLYSSPLCVAIENSIVPLYQDEVVLFLILKPTSLFLSNVNVIFRQFNGYPMYHIDNLTICINWIKNYQGDRSFVVDQVDNWITLKIPAKVDAEVNAKVHAKWQAKWDAKWQAKLDEETKASDARLQEALTHWQSQQKIKLAKKDAIIQALKAEKKKALQAVQQEKKDSKKEVKRIHAENVACYKKLRASESTVHLLKSRLETTKTLHQESLQSLQTKFNHERASLTTQLQDAKKELKVVQENINNRSKKLREDKLNLEKTIKDQRSQLKKLNSNQKMLDRVKEHFTKKKCLIQVEDVLSLLDGGKQQGWDVDTMQTIFLMKSPKEVRTAFRTYKQFYPIVKDVTSVQLEQYLEAMLKLMHTFGKENIHEKLDDVLFAHGFFQGKSIRKGIKLLQEQTDKNIKIIQGYDEVLSQVQQNDGTANDVLEQMETYFGTIDDIAEKVRLLLDEKQDQASMINVNVMVNDFFQGEEKDKQLKTFFEAHDTETREFNCMKVKMFAYHALLTPLLNAFGNSEWIKQLNTVMVNEMDHDELRTLGEYMARHHVFLPPGIQSDGTLHTREKEDFLVATNIDSFYHVWDNSLRKIVQGLSISWNSVGNHVYPKPFLRRVVRVSSLSGDVRVAMEIEGSVWQAQQNLATANQIDAPSDVILWDKELKQMDMHDRVPSEVVWVNCVIPTCRTGDFILVKMADSLYVSLFVHHCKENRIHAYNVREDFGAHQTIELSNYCSYPMKHCLEWCYLHDMGKDDTKFVFNMKDHVIEVIARIQRGNEADGLLPLIQGLVSDELLKHGFDFEKIEKTKVYLQIYDSEGKHLKIKVSVSKQFKDIYQYVSEHLDLPIDALELRTESYTKINGGDTPQTIGMNGGTSVRVSLIKK